ncbi:hypothetical protein Glove_16g96 [Diversispora epigaea]|uniref:Cation/H+ exchanger transmembrane domain-containing protein n=1 Tax=Diversispora epigaea TaxID=1348612 RepID=A0A397JTG4_9GLOM|nr:hypothetical protein Glove_16g96 [Diversispora epigaea]
MLPTSVIKYSSFIFLFLNLFLIKVLCSESIKNTKNEKSIQPHSSLYYARKYQRYIKTEMKRQITIKDSLEIPEFEKNKKINSITVAIARAGAFKDLTFGLLDIFDKLIDKNDSSDQSYFNAEALKLIYKFHHQALIMNDTEFLQHVWDLYVNNGIGINKTNEKHTDSQPKKSAFDIIKNVLLDVGIEADRIEENMHQHKFFDGSKIHGTLDMVVKLEDEDEYIEYEKENDPNSSQNEEHRHGVGKVNMLLDRDNNEYVLTRPNDLTAFYEDGRLVQDLIFIIITAFIFGGIFNSIGLPAFIGYIIAGCVLGPAGCNVIQELIQTETLAQLGVVFIVFMLGLEFSFDKIRSIWKFALCSATIIFISTLLFFVLAGAIINAGVKEAVVVGACVSLSSTAVVERLRCIELEPLYGLLVMQDVLFGVLLAAMPVLSRSGVEIFISLGNLLLSLILFGTFSLLIAYIPISGIFKSVKGSNNNNELFILGLISLCLLMSQVSYILGIGAEIGCFVAGMLVHNRRTLFEFSISLVEPIKDIFSCLFFASIGLHIYPSFLINEGPLLFALTTGAVGLKFIISNVAFMTFGYGFHHSNVMSIGLSQIGEFAFVLGSRAKGFGIISREVYYLLIATTSLTLIVTPILWKILCRNRLDGTSMIGVHKGLVKETEYTIPFTNDTEKVE